MTGRGLISNTTTKSSQIIGHVHGWIVGSPERVKESQKAQQRVESMMQGIYDDALSMIFCALQSVWNVPQSNPDDQDEF
jgi:hypothetical protein